HLLQTLITFLVWVDFIYYLLVSVLIDDDQVWLLLNLGDVGIGVVNPKAPKIRGISNVLFAASRLNFLIQQTTFYFDSGQWLRDANNAFYRAGSFQVTIRLRRTIRRVVLVTRLVTISYFSTTILTVATQSWLNGYGLHWGF